MTRAEGLLTRNEALALLDALQRAGRRPLSIEGFRLLDRKPMAVEGTYAEFSDTHGGGYTESQAIHDARVYLEVMQPDLLFRFELPPG